MTESAFVHTEVSGNNLSGCGCGCGGNCSGLSDSTEKNTPTVTEKEVVEEAQQYANPGVPNYNKLFGATLLIVTFLIFTGE
jgi:hypothetical protein